MRQAVLFQEPARWHTVTLRCVECGDSDVRYHISDVPTFTDRPTCPECGEPSTVVEIAFDAPAGPLA